MAAKTIYDVAEDFGLLYDEVPAYAGRGDVPFYVGEAARVNGGPATVLELGCGTGRLLLPLARAGHDVTGVDASSAMLTRCRAKLAAEPADVRSRAALHEADVRDLTLRRPAVAEAASEAGDGFTLVVAPFRILQHLVTPTDQLRCLSAVGRHLARGGRLVFDVFNPHFALMTADRSAEFDDTPERPMADGRHLRRTARVTRVHWTQQVSEVELIYYVRSGTEVERIVQAFAMRWYGVAELEHLLARTGFRVEAVYGDFDRSPLGDESPEIVVVAARERRDAKRE